MQHEINPDGTRYRKFRPTYFGETVTYHTQFYDPHNPVDYGLYSQGHQLLQDWQSHFKEHTSKLVHGGGHVPDPDYQKLGNSNVAQTHGVGYSNGSPTYYRRLHAH